MVASRLVPKATFAQVNYRDDAVQASILKSVGVEEPVSQIMAGNLASLHGEMGNRFKSYTLAGAGHARRRPTSPLQAPYLPHHSAILRPYRAGWTPTLFAWSGIFVSCCSGSYTYSADGQ